MRGVNHEGETWEPTCNIIDRNVSLVVNDFRITPIPSAKHLGHKIGTNADNDIIR